MDEAALQKSFFLGFRRRVYKTKNSVIESKVPRYKLQKSSSGPNESYESKQVKKIIVCHVDLSNLFPWAPDFPSHWGHSNVTVSAGYNDVESLLKARPGNQM